MFPSWISCVELSFYAPHPDLPLQIQKCNLELITEAWAIDMQVNTVFNAV